MYFLSKGLSPDLQSMEQIRRIMRPTDVPDTGKKDYTVNLNSMWTDKLTCTHHGPFAYTVWDFLY